MKLVFVAPHYPPEFLGGVEAVVRAHARALAAVGHEVRIVTGTHRAHAGQDIVRDAVDGIDVLRVPRLPEESYDLELDRPRVANAVRRAVSDAELVHVHHWATLTGSLVRDLGDVAPVVVTLHDFFPTCPRFFRHPVADELECPPAGRHDVCAACVAPDAPGRSLGELEERLDERAERFRAELDAARKIVVPSRTHLVRLAEFLDFGPGQASIVPPGLCHDFSRRRRRPRAWGGDGPLRVLHFGRRSIEKGSLDLVLALAAQPTGAVELVALGGAEPGLDDALADAAPGVAMELGGVYDTRALERAAAGCHLAALPTRLPESYSLALDEALALGLPTWSSAGGPGRERFGPGVLTTLPGGDPVAWARAIGEVLARPEVLSDAFAALPARVPRADEAATSLERIYEELLYPTTAKR